jgi:hypothetical protein
VEWPGPNSLRVSAGEVLRWEIDVESTLATRSLNLASSLMPESWWHKERVLAAIARVAQEMLQTGPVRFSGRTPNAQKFVANPRRIWSVRQSRATVAGIDLGLMGPLPVQAHLGDFLIPQRGLFAIAHSFLRDATA